MPLCDGCKNDDHGSHRGQFTVGWPRTDRYARRVHGHRTVTCECWRCTNLDHNPYEPIPSDRGAGSDYFRAAWYHAFGITAPRMRDVIAAAFPEEAEAT